MHHMQAVLLQQHRELLALDPQWWLSRFFQSIILNPTLAQALYIMSAILELFFLTGFFSFRYDNRGRFLHAYSFW
jgi:hypothetical protein